MAVDLHTHTIASDGSLKPRQLIERAKQVGLKAIAITDHDTVDGLQEGLEAAQSFQIELIPGIELNSYHGEDEIHVLGYFINWRDKKFRNILSELASERIRRVQQIISRLGELGIHLCFEQVKSLAGQGVIGRPHLAQILINHSYAESIKDAFERYLVKGAPAYVPREKISVEQAIKIVKEAKGIPVLAHPGLITAQEIVPQLLKAGFVGMEVYHPDHNPEQEKHYLETCRDYKLIATGGSDFHGDFRETELGRPRVNYKVIQELKEARRKLY